MSDTSRKIIGWTIAAAGVVTVYVPWWSYRVEEGSDIRVEYNLLGHGCKVNPAERNRVRDCHWGVVKVFPPVRELVAGAKQTPSSDAKP